MKTEKSLDNGPSIHISCIIHIVIKFAKQFSENWNMQWQIKNESVENFLVGHHNGKLKQYTPDCDNGLSVLYSFVENYLEQWPIRIHSIPFYTTLLECIVKDMHGIPFSHSSSTQ